MDILQKITGNFHKVLSSIENWLNFQERYFVVDDQLSTSLETMQSSVFSELHGWSPAAFEGMTQSVGQITTLMQMSGPILKEHGVFTPELLGQLKGSIHATMWSFNDWFHEISSH